MTGQAIMVMAICQRDDQFHVRHLKRIFSIDVDTCADCGGKLRVIACVEGLPLIRKILAHVRAPGELAGVAARASPLAKTEGLKLR